MPAQALGVLVAHHDEQMNLPVTGEDLAELIEDARMPTRAAAESGEDVFGVVEHDEDGAAVGAPVVPAQVGADGEAGEPDRVLEWRPGSQQREDLRIAVFGQHGGGHEGGTPDRAHGQHVEAGRVEAGQHAGGHEGGLSDTRWPVQDREPVTEPQLLQLGDIMVTSEEFRHVIPERMGGPTNGCEPLPLEVM
ncbi:hypothetical protein GCM10020001_078010 [Nonomuraea salmonea]